MLLQGLAAALLLAADLPPTAESWTDFTGTIWRNQRTEVNGNIQLRTYPSILEPYRLRTGPIVEHRLHPKFSLIGGMYFQHLELGTGDNGKWYNMTRWFGGGSYPVWHSRTVQIDGRTLAERFIGGAAPDWNRYRTRVLVNFNRRVAPYVGNELFAINSGLHTNRTQGGIRWRLNNEMTLLTGYLFEYRGWVNLPGRHAVVLSVIYRRSAPE